MNPETLYRLLSTLNLTLGGLAFLLGLIILRENPGQRLNRIVAMMLSFGGFGAVVIALALLAPPATGARATAAQHVLQNVSYVWEFFFPTLFLFASIFPEERAFTRRPMLAGARFWLPSFGALVFVPHVFHLVLVLVTSVWKPELLLPRIAVLSPLVGLIGVLSRLFLGVHSALFSLVNLGFGLATMLLLLDSYRRARVPRLKQQLRVIGIGLSACLVCYSFATLIPTLLNLRLPEGMRPGLTVAALLLGPGSIAYSIVRYKFLDTRLLAQRGILYALVSAALVGVYLLLRDRVRDFMGQWTGVRSDVFEPVLLVMALALFQPVIARLEELLDRMRSQDPSDYRNVVRRLGRELQTTIDLEVVLSRTVRTLADAMLVRVAHIVAFTADRPIAHTGAGAPLDAGALQQLAALLPRIAPRHASVRLADRIEDLTPEEQAVLTDRMGLALLVPLRWRGDLVGALLLGEKVTGTAHTSEDVTMLTTLAGQVSVSLQNALLLRDRVAVATFEQELNLARQIQRTSLLSEFPPVPRCDVHAVYRPSKHVGGDFYDVVPTGDGGYLVAIADVSGKGVPAALLSAMLQASLRTQAATVSSPCEVLRNINTLLYRSTATHQFATFFLAHVDGARLRMAFSNAGHNWPFVLRRGERMFLERGGTILGILESAAWEEESIALEAGDVVVLYTDGISEAANAAGEQFGESRLYEFVESLAPGMSSRDVAAQVLDALHAFLGDVEPQDDVTLLVLRVLEPVPSAPATAVLPETVATA